MDHQKSKVVVYTTTDYKKFRFRPGNRDTNAPSQVNKRKNIKREIESGNDCLDECPILVYESGAKLDIDDGQNRFLVAQELGRPVHYIIKEKKLSLYNLAKLNSNSDGWNKGNFLELYIADGNQHYIDLQKFHKKYGFAIGVCVRLLKFGLQTYKDDGSLKDLFESGRFEVEQAKEARLFAETCKNFSAFPSWSAQGFVVAMSKILKAGIADMDILKRKFDKDPAMLKKQSNARGYLNNLAEIYNIGNAKQRPIY